EQDLLREQVKLEGLFKSLNEDNRRADRRAATLERGRKALDDLDKQIRAFSEERDQLAKTKPLKGQKALDLSRGDAQLRDVKKGRDELAKAIGRWETILKEGNSAETQDALANLEVAQNLEKLADYGRAIELYEKVFAQTKDAKLGQRLEKLKEAWKPKSDEHAKARAFIYDTWSKLEPRAVTKARVKEAQDALAACRKAKDPLGPRKLLAVAIGHARQLNKELGELS